MAGTPGATSLLIHDFTVDEIEVADILARLKSLIPLYESRNIVPLTTPSWVSKRPRSATVLPAVLSSTRSQPDRPNGDSAVVPGEGNLRNASPVSPVPLKSSPESCLLQGSTEPTTRDKKGRKNKGRPVPDGCKKDDDDDGDVDDSAGIIRSKKKLKKVNDNERVFLDGLRRNGENRVPESDLPLQIDVTLTLASQPHGAHTSPAPPHASRTQLMFDLNLLPESPGSPTDHTGCMPPHDGAASDDDGSSRAQPTTPARKRSFEICTANEWQGRSE